MNTIMFPDLTGYNFSVALSSALDQLVALVSRILQAVKNAFKPAEPLVQPQMPPVVVIPDPVAAPVPPPPVQEEVVLIVPQTPEPAVPAPQETAPEPAPAAPGFSVVGAVASAGGWVLSTAWWATTSLVTLPFKAVGLMASPNPQPEAEATEEEVAPLLARSVSPEIPPGTEAATPASTLSRGFSFSGCADASPFPSASSSEPATPVHAAAAPQIPPASKDQEAELDFTISTLGTLSMFTVTRNSVRLLSRKDMLRQLHPLRFLSLILQKEALRRVLPGICNHDGRIGSEFRANILADLEACHAAGKLVPFLDEFAQGIGRPEITPFLKDAAEANNWKGFLQIVVPDYELK